ncbi:MAG: competence protein [Myxococcaceae bacterium]|nr:competence protein [Myxococcaceae bacterium]
MASFDLQVTQRQIAVFAAQLDCPFSEWNGRHVAQGFAWRPLSVAFRTFDDGPLTVTATRTRSADLPSGSRIIRVPFEVPKNGQLKVASGLSFKELHLPAGSYDLTFEHGLDLEGQWCTLLFTACDAASEALVLLADAELHPATPLLMKASPRDED